jgi:hypothetical protein
MAGFPPYASDRGIAGTVAWGDLAGNPVNEVVTPLMTYLQGAYGGWRGGIRWKVILATYDIDINTITAVRNPENNTPASFNIFSQTVPTIDAVGMVIDAQIFGDIWLGAAVTVRDNMPCLEYEAPYLVPVKYSYNNCIRNSNLSASSDKTNRLGTSVIVNYTSTLAQQDIAAHFYCAAGEDFNLIWFICAPPLRTY